MQRSRHYTLQTKFLFSLTLTGLIIGGLLGIGLYLHMSDVFEDEVREKAQFVLSQVDSVQEFVRGTLRPRMYQALPDRFIIEAMSSSFISRKIMENVGQGPGHHIYRRVAISARNPEFEANAMERELIEHFRASSGDKLYQGYRTIDDVRYFVMARPVAYGPGCMHCHGTPADAPRELVPHYGLRGFGHQEGAVDGLDFVGLPVSASVALIQKTVTTYVVIFGLAALLFIATTSLIFRQVVVNNMRNLTSLFRRIITDEKGTALFQEIERGDELDGMIDGVEKLGDHLYETRLQLQEYAANLEQMVKSRTDELAREAGERRADVELFVRLLEVLGRSQSRTELWQQSLPHIARRFGLDRVTYVCTFASSSYYSWPDSDVPPDLPDDWLDLLTEPRSLVESRRAFIPVESSEGNAEGILCLYGGANQAFLPRDREVLETVGRQLGMAIGNIVAVDSILRSKANLQSIFEGIADPLLLMDSASGFVIANQAARDLAGELSGGEAANGDLTPYLCRPGGDCDIDRAMRAGRTLSREVVLDDGRTFGMSIYPVRGDAGETSRAVVYVHETTGEKRLMALATQSEKMATVGKLAAGLAHEINNPLGVILCYAELLKNSPARDEGREDVDVIIRHTRQAQSVLRDLLNFARPKVSTTTAVDLADVVASVVDVFRVQAEKRGAAMVLEGPDRALSVRIEPQTLEHIVANLLLNALDAVPVQGGLVEIALSGNGDGVALLRVRDNGSGIPEEHLQRVFDPFFSTKEVNRGSGLGLAVVYGFMRDIGGGIDVGNHPDGGAVFELRFPAAGPDAVRVQRPANKEDAP